MRPIDADAILKKLSRMCDYCHENGLENEMSALFQVGDAVIDCPTLDYKDLVPQGEYIAELLKAEAEERLVVLPCKVGSTLYRIQHEYKTGNPFIRAVTFNRNNFWRIVFGGEFGKTVFLTREEAVAALRGADK